MAKMNFVFLAASLLVGLGGSFVGSTRDRLSSNCYKAAPSIHDLALTSLDGTSLVPLSVYKGQVLIVVNVASFCTFTYQYLDFNKLKAIDEFRDRLEIVAIPSNQFGLQEPGANENEILNSLKYVRPGNGYEPDFDVYQKSDVNGVNELPLYTALKRSCPAVREVIGDPTMRFWSPFKNNDITWNFNKFLIGPDGVPLKRYDSEVEPMELVGDIQAVLSASEYLRQKSSLEGVSFF